MTVKYDDFFAWLKKQDQFPEGLKSNQYIYLREGASSSSSKVARYSFSNNVFRNKYKGLELLLGNELIVGGPSAIESELEGIFVGEQYTAPKQMADLSSFQVFEVPESSVAADNSVLPVVARISIITKTIKDKPYIEYQLEYCPAAANYGIK